MPKILRHWVVRKSYKSFIAITMYKKSN